MTSKNLITNLWIMLENDQLQVFHFSGIELKSS